MASLRCVWGLGDGGGGCGTEKGEVWQGREMERKKKKSNNFGRPSKANCLALPRPGLWLAQRSQHCQGKDCPSLSPDSPLHPLPVQPTREEPNWPLLPSWVTPHGQNKDHPNILGPLIHWRKLLGQVGHEASIPLREGIYTQKCARYFLVFLL